MTAVRRERKSPRSGSGAYATLVQGVTKATRQSYGQGGNTDPKVIAGVVSNAVRSRRPQTRYAAGKYAKPMMWIRKWLGDRVFDGIVMSQVR